MNSSNQFDESFIIHSCEQVLRFTRVDRWDDLSEERKVQLGFNMGVVSLGLKLTKEQGFQFLTNAREGKITMQAFRDHLKSVVDSNQIKVDEAKVAKPF